MSEARGGVLIIAGEASADVHGAHLVAELKKRVPDLPVWGMGGAAMRAVGFEALVPAEAMSIAGLTEVLLALPRILWLMARLRRAAARRRPSVAVLIDMPDFNLRFALRLKRLGVPVVYYISPQVWAWRQGRVKQIRARVDEMLVILPFEEAFYRERGVPAQFVGHPLVEELPAQPDRRAARQRLALTAPGPVVALLPGSRLQEVRRHLPVMLAAWARLQRRYPTAQAVLPVASTIPAMVVEALVERGGGGVRILQGQATDALAAADAAVVCSGTSTLQAALLARPMVVVYRVSWLTFLILKRLVKVAHVALVNLIAGRRLVTELLQHDLTAENVEREIAQLLDDAPARARLEAELSMMRRQLAPPAGEASTAARVATVVAGYVARSAVAAGAP